MKTACISLHWNKLFLSECCIENLLKLSWVVPYSNRLCSQRLRLTQFSNHHLQPLLIVWLPSLFWSYYLLPYSGHLSPPHPISQPYKCPQMPYPDPPTTPWSYILAVSLLLSLSGLWLVLNNQGSGHQCRSGWTLISLSARAVES